MVFCFEGKIELRVDDRVSRWISSEVTEWPTPVLVLACLFIGLVEGSSWHGRGELMGAGIVVRRSDGRLTMGKRVMVAGDSRVIGDGTDNTSGVKVTR